MTKFKVTRFPNGISTNEQQQLLGEYGLPDPTKWNVYFTDFNTYTAADWTITETGVATQALADEDGGVLLITNAAADDDASFSQKVGESFLFEVGKQLFFKTKMKISDATQSDFIFGLQITDTTPLDVSDGVFFNKADASNQITLEVEKDDTATSTNVAIAADDTYIELGFHYDGISSIFIFSDGALVGKSEVTNLPDDEELTISYGIQNGEAVAKTKSIDYILVAKER